MGYERMVTKEKFNELINRLETQKIVIKNDSIYFIGTKRRYINFTELCRIKIEKKKQYILNKNRNIVTDNIEIFNEYLTKKKAGVRGYKTIKMGVIENYYYQRRLEYTVLGSDIDGYYWWIDWDNQIRVPKDIKRQITDYVDSLSSEFISA